MKKKEYLNLIQEHEETMAQLEASLRQTAKLYHTARELSGKICTEMLRRAPEPIQPPAERYEERVHPATKKKLMVLVPASLEPPCVKRITVPDTFRRIESHVMSRLVALTGDLMFDADIWREPAPLPEAFRATYEKLKADVQGVADEAA